MIEMCENRYCVDMGKHNIGDVLVVVECSACGGSGRVKNKWFERCAVEGKDLECNEDQCEWYEDCFLGEVVNCDRCNGAGKILKAGSSLDEQEWLKNVIRGYRRLLGQKYGDDNFSFVIITMVHEGDGTVTGFKAGYTSDTLKRAVEFCKDLLALTFALEKKYMEESKNEKQ